MAKLSFVVPCLICGESCPITNEEEMRLQYGHSIHSHVCDNCKNAILRMRAMFRQEEEG